MNLIEFSQYFKDEQVCIDWLINERFDSKENIACPHHTNKKIHNFLISI